MTDSIEPYATFEDFWLGFCEHMAFKRGGNWVFRGLADKDFDLMPSIGRQSIWGTGHYTPSRERDVLSQFEHVYQQDYPYSTLLEFAALGQHYGLPTRLLDWTTNLLAAAYFVVSGGPETLSKDGIIYMVSVPKESVSHNIEDPFILADRTEPGFVHVPHFDVRMDRQQGLFSLHPDPTKPWQVRDHFTTEPFIVEQRFKDELRRTLRPLGFSSVRLIPQIAETCNTIRNSLKKG